MRNIKNNYWSILRFNNIRIDQVASASFGNYVDAKNFWRLITMYLHSNSQQCILLQSV